MTQHFWLEHGCAIALVVGACAWELKTTRIPNVFPLVGLGLGLVFGALDHRLGDHGLGFAVAFVVSVLVYRSGGLGGGAVKLLIALGSLLGLGEFINLGGLFFAGTFVVGLAMRRVKRADVPTGPLFVVATVVTTLVALHTAASALPPH